MQRTALKPTVDEKACVGCGVCAENCPSNAIQVNEKAEINPVRCTGCGICVRICPQNAIKLTSSQPSSDTSTGKRLESLRERAEKLGEGLSEIEEELQKMIEASSN